MEIINSFYIFKTFHYFKLMKHFLKSFLRLQNLNLERDYLILVLKSLNFSSWTLYSPNIFGYWNKY